jgi:hypothetical protein
MSKVGLVYWQVTAALFIPFLVYMESSLVINTYIVIGYIVVTLVWVSLPLILLQWYMWSKD